MAIPAGGGSGKLVRSLIGRRFHQLVHGPAGDGPTGFAGCAEIALDLLEDVFAGFSKSAATTSA
jgi:hypothetical protein